MKPTSFLILLAATSTVAIAKEIYYGPTTPSEVAIASPLTASGGGVDLRVISGPAFGDSESAGGVRLTQAAISPTTASPIGYVTYESDALDAGTLALEGDGIEPFRTPGASEYRYGLGQGGGNALWNIAFSGTPPKDTPIADNYFPAKVDEAIAHARTAIRANPFHTGPGSGYALLFQAAYEATVPYTWSGNEWRAKAEKDRLGDGQPLNASISQRLNSLDTACLRYREACEAFLSLLNHPVESAYLLSPEPIIGDAGPAWLPPGEERAWSGMLYEAYAQALETLADGRFEYFYTRYLDEYRPPEVGGFDPEALAAEIHAIADEIDRLALPLSGLAGAGVLDPDIEVGAATERTSLMRRLADHIIERAVFFSPGVNPLTNGFAYSTYGANYVPFLVPAQLASKPFSFDNFAGFTYGNGQDLPLASTAADPSSLIGVAKLADADAQSAVEAVIQTVQEVDDLRADTRQTYQTQLGELCGLRRADSSDLNSELIPDVLGYLLPLEERGDEEVLLARGETNGGIGLSWKKIDQAETRLFSAYRALAEIDEEAQIIREYGDERLLSYDRIAKIQLNTGEEISALDYLSGEVRAKAIEEEAEEKAKQAEKKSWFSGIGKMLAKGIGAFVTGGASLVLETAWLATEAALVGDNEGLAAIGSIIDQQQAAKSQAEMHRNIGRIQANAARRQAEIQAQQTRIRAMEGAQITMEQGGQEENRIREAIQKLMIRVERQKLEILLAKQQLEFAEMEHSNLIGRISYLLQEYRKVSTRQALSTLNRPDVRLQRDYEINEAQRKFRVAQEYSFLCARAARYRFTGKPTDSFQSQIGAIEQAILTAQNGELLEEAVSGLINVRGQFLSATGGMAQLQEVRFSVRDLVAQSNHWISAFFKEDNGTWLPGLGDYDLQGFPQSTLAGGGTVAELSDAEFVQYLERNMFPVGSGSQVLRLRFPIGFEPSFEDRLNPLRLQTTGEYGHVIEGPGPSYASTAAAGVFVNIRNNRSVNPNGLMPSTASLRPVGSFYTTSSPQPSSTEPVPLNAIKVWNPSDKQGSSALKNSVRILYNKDTLTPAWASRFPELTLGSAGSQLHERSPANDHWLLEITASNSVWNVFLQNMRDVEICMTIRGWTN